MHPSKSTISSISCQINILPCPVQFNVSLLDSATIYFLVQCCYCKATPLFWDLVMWFLRSECQWIDPCHQEADRETLILPVHMLRKTVGGSDVKRWKNILLTSPKKTFHSFKTTFISWHEWSTSVGSMTKIIGYILSLWMHTCEKKLVEVFI